MSVEESPCNQPRQTEDLKAVIEIFDSVTAIVSQAFLKLFNFADHDSCKKLLVEVAEVSSVEFSSSPGTNPDHPAFSLTGSLSCLLKTESFLFEKFQELNKVESTEPDVGNANGLQMLAEVTEGTICASSVMSEPFKSPELQINLTEYKKSSVVKNGQLDQGLGISTGTAEQSFHDDSTVQTVSTNSEANGPNVIPPTLASNKESNSSLQVPSHVQVQECKVSPENRKYETLCTLLGFGKSKNKLLHGKQPGGVLETRTFESKGEVSHNIEGQPQSERAPAKPATVVPSIISKVHTVLEQCRGEKRKRKDNVMGAEPDRKQAVRIKQKASHSETGLETYGDPAGKQRVTISSSKTERGMADKSHPAEENKSLRRSVRNRKRAKPWESPDGVEQTIVKVVSTTTLMKRLRSKHASTSAEGETSDRTEMEEQDDQPRNYQETTKTPTASQLTEASQVECRQENEENNHEGEDLVSSEVAETGGSSVSSDDVSRSADLLKDHVVTLSSGDLGQLGRNSQNVESANSVSNVPPRQTGQIKRSKRGSLHDFNNLGPEDGTELPPYSNIILREIDMFRADYPVELFQTVESNNKTVIMTQGGHCPICGQEFESPQSFSAHVMYSHFKFKCQKCLAVFSKREVLVDHLRDENICQGPRLKSRRRKRRDARSESTPSKRKDLRCGDCDLVFGHRSRLDRHQLEAHNPVIVCSVCNETFQSFARLRVHIDLIHTEQEHICDVCGKSFKALANMLGHRKRHNAEKRFVCENCGKAFKDKCAWKEHLETHKPKEERTCRFVCSTCGKRFQSKQVCLDHQNTHTGTRPYECHLCHLRFASLGIMKSHLKMKHSDNRPFQCEICPKAFKEKRALQAHTVTHTGISEHRCLHCGRPFGTATICKTHMLKCKQSKEVNPTASSCELSETSEGMETLVVETTAVEVHPDADENQSAVETMELTFDDQQIAELQVTTEVAGDPLVFMCSACSETFDDMESAASHISVCQVERKEILLS